MTIGAPTRRDPARHPLFERLSREFHYAAPAVEDFDAFAGRAGHTLLFFADDPERIKEALDLEIGRAHV